MSAYRHYTDAEIAAANDTDLPELLRRLGYHVRRVGRYYTTSEMDSLRVRDRRTWWRYSDSTGGDAVEFLRRFHGMLFPEAVGYLLDFSGLPDGIPGDPVPVRKTRPPPRTPPVFVLPPPNADDGRVRAYLVGRGIAPGVVDGFIRSGLLYEDERHNCVFVGHNRTGTPVFAAKRGTSDGFRGDVPGSDKRVAFRTPYVPALDAVHVFEAPIDLMSWITLYGPCNAVALCGLHDAPLAAYLRDHQGIRRIALCLDADGPGREAAGRLGAKYRAAGYGVMDYLPPLGKDWNEFIQRK
ncbi:DUF3991 and toprim domain-containing protein [uncultured Alistipes sp.]|uniref:DUF3991 and toprim domain-containing protein n=1 Tax=uncultured Alistipes sp. TaxID=538949 RepID=UPI00272B5959|nr:DUF3991 and toprim domain-containing protein [uncultured Alistipes sp.]